MSVQLPTLDDYKSLEAKVDRLECLLEQISKHVRAPQVVTIADICSIEGVSKSQIMYREAYLLPNFGISEYPEGVRRWNWETFMKWRALPVDKRKAMYDRSLERAVLIEEATK